MATQAQVIAAEKQRDDFYENIVSLRAQLEEATRLLEPFSRACPEWLFDLNVDDKDVPGMTVLALWNRDLRAVASFVAAQATTNQRQRVFYGAWRKHGQ